MLQHLLLVSTHSSSYWKEMLKRKARSPLPPQVELWWSSTKFDLWLLSGHLLEGCQVTTKGSWCQSLHKTFWRPVFETITRGTPNLQTIIFLELERFVVLPCLRLSVFPSVLLAGLRHYWIKPAYLVLSASELLFLGICSILTSTNYWFSLEYFCICSSFAFRTRWSPVQRQVWSHFSVWSPLP